MNQRRATIQSNIMEVAMRVIVAMLALIGATTAGCLQIPPQPPLPPTTMSSWGPNGGFTLSSGVSTCGGHATLSAGHTSITDPCFTGVDNVVMCTDTSNANAVQCSSSSGYLAISGFGNDTISYARVR
jgi:hypothetical protein